MIFNYFTNIPKQWSFSELNCSISLRLSIVFLCSLWYIVKGNIGGALIMRAIFDFYCRFHSSSTFRIQSHCYSLHDQYICYSRLACIGVKSVSMNWMMNLVVVSTFQPRFINCNSSFDINCYPFRCLLQRKRGIIQITPLPFCFLC